MLELFRKRLYIVPWEECGDVCGLRRIASDKLNRLVPLEDARDFITRHQNRNPPPRTAHPLSELSLGMRVRAIHFIENQTQGSHVASKERRDASCMGAGLRQGINVGVTAKGLGCIELQRFKSLGQRRRKRKRGLPNAWRTMEQEDLGIGRRPKIRLNTGLHIRMSNHPLHSVWTPSFTPHVRVSSPSRK